MNQENSKQEVRLQTNATPPVNTWARQLTRYTYMDTYRTRDGLASFSFGFFETGDRIEIDILDMPGYGDRPADPHLTHRMPAPRGGYQIDTGVPERINGLTMALRIAELWAEHTWAYIQNGQPFPV